MDSKKSNLLKLLLWLGTFFEEDNGKASQKRLLAFIMGMVSCFHAVKDSNNTEILITLFSFIAVLLGMTYIPTRKTDTEQPKEL